MDGDFSYLGSELELFAAARNWRAYWRSQVAPFLGVRVLEVGAGIGTITQMLCGPGIERWLALEPDVAMASRTQERLRQVGMPPACAVRGGTTRDLSAGELFDTAIYIDVLEHIKDDREEVARAYRHLIPSGRLIVLAPAHQALYSPFDAAIGHFRRYSRRQLLALSPPGATVMRVRYLDSVGLFATLGNRLLLRQAHPTERQILLWDRAMVPVSRLVDPLFGFHCGKSVLVVWQKAPG